MTDFQASEPSVRRLRLHRLQQEEKQIPKQRCQKTTSTHPNYPFLMASKSQSTNGIHPSNTKSM